MMMMMMMMLLLLAVVIVSKGGLKWMIKLVKVVDIFWYFIAVTVIR